MKYMKKIISGLLLSLVAIQLMLAPALQAESATATKKIAILQAIEHPALNQTRQGILDEINAFTEHYDDLAVEYYYESAQGQSVLAWQIAQKFAKHKPDVIVAIATTAAQACLPVAKKHGIPLVFASVTDPINAGLSAASGVSNYITVAPQLKMMRDILPSLTTLGIIYNPGEANSISINKEILTAATAQNINTIFMAANNTAEVPATARQLVNKKVDAVYVSNDNTALAGFKSIVAVATKKKIPVFASDTAQLEHGALAALGPNQYLLGKQVGKMIEKILTTKSENRVNNIDFPEVVELHINLDMAKKIDLPISQQVLDAADNIWESKQ